MKPRRLLVMQLARLGDLVQTWPLLSRLRQAHPGVELGLWCDGALAPLTALGPALEEVHGLDLAGLSSRGRERPARAFDLIKGGVAQVRERNYDLVYNLNFSRISLLLAHLAGAPVRGHRPLQGGREFGRDPWLAFAYGLVHGRRFNRLHLSDVFRHLAPAPESEAAPPAPKETLRTRVIALQLATRHPKRTWPLAAFTRLAAQLVEGGVAHLWLLGSARERPLGEGLRAGLPPAARERAVNLQGSTDLTELAARVRETDLVISGDTGTLHLAAALGTRTLGLFLGPAQCFETGPYGPGHLVVQAEPPCHPCLEAAPGCEEPPCAAMITPELAAHLAFNEEPSPGLIPAGTRIYHSFIDDLGVNYRTAGEGAAGLADLVGQAYRRAGAGLLGELRLPTSAGRGELTPGSRQELENLVATLRNGALLVGLKEAPEALKPLLAFGAEIKSQAAWQGGEALIEESFGLVKKAFLGQLEELLN